jgi:hypothetical protein
MTNGIIESIVSRSATIVGDDACRCRPHPVLPSVEVCDEIVEVKPVRLQFDAPGWRSQTPSNNVVDDLGADLIAPLL